LPHFSVRLDDDLVRRFDAAAASRGGRSRLLRRLMEEAAQASLPEAGAAMPAGRTGKLTLRLGETDLARLEAEAAVLGLSRTQWSVAVIRRRLHRRPQLTPPEAFAFIEVQRELRRIGVNINQIARAMNTAVLEGTVLDLEIAQVAAFADEIRAHLTGLTAAFEGNLAYWSDGT